MQIRPYLFFEGRCEEAIAFYRKALGAEVLMMMRYKDSPDADHSHGKPEGIMHASIKIDEAIMSLSDGMCSGKPDFSGFALSLDARDPAHAKKLYDALCEGGTITMPLGETFYAHAFAMVHDKFNIHWMIIVAKEM